MAVDARYSLRCQSADESEVDLAAFARGSVLGIGRRLSAPFVDMAELYGALSKTDTGYEEAEEETDESKGKRLDRRLDELITDRSGGLIHLQDALQWSRSKKMALVLLQSKPFEIFISLCIVANCVTIGLSAERCPPATSIRSAADCPTVFLEVTEHFFTALFLGEFLIQFWVYGPMHYAKPATCADAVIVWVTGVLNTWFLQPMGIDLEFMRLLMVFRTFRLMRAVKAARRQLKEMWILLQGLVTSGRTLFWTIVILLLVEFVFGVLLLIVSVDSAFFGDLERQSAACQAGTGPCDPAVRQAVTVAIKYFGTGLEGTLGSLFQTVTGDSTLEAWVRPLAEEDSLIMAGGLLFFMAGNLVVLNLVTAVIVDNALALTKEDVQQKLWDLEKEEKKNMDRLMALFHDLDADESGELSLEELEESFHDKHVRDQFDLLDITQKQAVELFHMLDVGGDGTLSADEFINGMTLVKHEPKSWELLKFTVGLEHFSAMYHRFFECIEAANGAPLSEASEPYSSQGKALARKTSEEPRTPGEGKDTRRTVRWTEETSMAIQDVTTDTDDGQRPQLVEPIEETVSRVARLGTRLASLSSAVASVSQVASGMDLQEVARQSDVHVCIGNFAAALHASQGDPSTVRGALTRAIATLESPGDTRSQSPVWRMPTASKTRYVTRVVTGRPPRIRSRGQVGRIFDHRRRPLAPVVAARSIVL